MVVVGTFVVKEPTTNLPSEARLTWVPATVAAGPPADRVFPSTRTFEEDFVNVRPPTVKTGPATADNVGRILVLEDPISNAPEGPREITVPEIVAALPPGESVVLPTVKPVGFAVMICPPTVKMSAVGTAGIFGNRVLDDPIVRMPE